MAFVVASTAVGELLRAAPRPARVVAAGESAVYLEVSGQAWVALLARDAVRVPIGLVTALPRRARPFDAVEVGTAAWIGGGELCLTAPGDHHYRPLRYWDPTVPRLCGALATTSVGRRAETLAILAAGLPEADTLLWSERAGLLERALAPAVPSPERLGEAALALTGLGPGLTPAGDDVLAGALVTLAAAGDAPRREGLARAVGDVLPRTTPVSAALLGEACHGRAVPEVAALLRAVAGSGDLDAALAALALVGHTSGAALALGVRAALRARCGRALRRCA